MVENGEHATSVAVKERSFMEKIEDKFHHHHHNEEAAAAEPAVEAEGYSSSSSTDFEHEKHAPDHAPAPVISTPTVKESSSSIKAKVNRLFGREKHEYAAEERPRFGISLGLLVDCLNKFSVPGHSHVN